MHGNIPLAPESATTKSVISAAENTFDGISVEPDDEQWFTEACRVLIPAKPGTQLHFSTGFGERECQRYAAGHVKPPAYFLRRLLRSEQGYQFLAALMDGSAAHWWKDLQGARQLTNEFKIERKPSVNKGEK